MEKFLDDQAIRPDAKDSVYRMAELGMLQGDELGNFRPTDGISRQDFALVLDRLINASNALDDISRQKTLMRIANTVVEVRAPNGGIGAGVLLPSGKILTNAHVVSTYPDVAVKWSSPFASEDLRFAPFPKCPVIKRNETADLALVDTGMLELPGVTMAPDWVSFEDLDKQISNEVYVQGSPLGHSGLISMGIFSKLEFMVGGAYLVVNAAVNPGNSGGPVFNAQGELIGIVTAKPDNAMVDGLGYIIPLFVIQGFLNGTI